jgi:hypothetical protein
MWSSAVYDLRLSDDAFFSLTPRKFSALQKRHKYHTESNELLFGQLTSWIANTGFKSCEKPTSIEDFMPSKWQQKAGNSSSNDKPTPKVTRRKRDLIATELRQVLAAFGAVKRS